MRTSRLKCFHVPDGLLLQLFTAGLFKDGKLAVPVCSGIPEGASIVGIWPDHSTRGLDLIVEHPDFPEVEPGVKCPTINEPWRIEHRMVYLTEPEIAKTELRNLCGEIGIDASPFPENGKLK